MNTFHSRGYGFSSQFPVKATAKKMAKSVVGNSMRASHPLLRGSAPPGYAAYRTWHATAGTAGGSRRRWAPSGGRRRAGAPQPAPGSAARLERLDQLGQDLVDFFFDGYSDHREDGGVLVLVDG